MAWEVEFTNEFETWWNSLSEDEQEEIAAKVELLEEHGPSLGRPHADVITTLASLQHERVAGEGARKREEQIFAGSVCI